MAAFTHYDVPRNPFSDESNFELEAEALREGPAEERWPIRQCVLLWVVLSVTGWALVAGLANYLT